MQDFEKLGLFYLGKTYDMSKRRVTSNLLLYESKDLTTHAVCVGMTGSGKTGLAIALLEEAAIDGIPAIAIDPKGDLGNLLLGFPELRAADFLPWIDFSEAERRGMAPGQFASQTAEQWREGLNAWGEDGERIARFKSAVELTIYTPGSTAGLPLTVLRSFAAPPPSVLGAAEAYRERLTAAASGLLALLGIEDEPVSSREHILLTNILDHAWRGGHDLDIEGLIHSVQAPPFQKVGALDLESFFSAKNRFALAMRLNNLLASPGFAGWLEGAALDIPSLLHTREGRPRLSIVSIAHLSDNERMFFVTILLNEVLSWVRAQQGTSSLRAILYMDEIFGYFPPTANPPSKLPMLTLLKQARAFGLGVVVATQNPVDLDYKGLSNAGTWFLGRLQTKRDKERVLDGLEGASAAAGHDFNRAEMDRLLSTLGNRVFVMNNVHNDRPVLFQTRWTLSYLRGPLARDQIEALMMSRKLAAADAATEAVSSRVGTSTPTLQATAAAACPRPVIPPDVPEFFVPRRYSVKAGEALMYRPALLGVARLHYADKKAGIDHWATLALLQPISGSPPTELWQTAEQFDDGIPELEMAPEAGARFASLLPALTRATSYLEWTKALKSYLYRERTLQVWSCPGLKQFSRAGEPEREFRLRLVHASREERDQKVEELRAQYAPKLESIESQKRRARERLEREQAQAGRSAWDATVALGTSVLGALLGRKKISQSTVTRAASAAKSAGKAMQQRGGVRQSEETIESLQRRSDELETKFRDEVEALAAALRPEALELKPLALRPKKSDITVERVVLAWMPFRIGGEGEGEPAY
jgi:hypothetical protein